MSNNQDWIDDDEFDFEDEGEETTTRGRNSDDVLKKVRRAERAKDKQLKELQSELESLRKFQREATVSKVLQEKGINPKIAALIPQNLDSTPEALNSWLEQFGDIFGIASQPQQQAKAVVVLQQLQQQIQQRQQQQRAHPQQQQQRLQT